MGEKTEQYQILIYLDELEKARRAAQKKKLRDELLEGIQTVIDDMFELESSLDSEEGYKRLKENVEELVENLLSSCKKGDEVSALSFVNQLRKQVRSLSRLKPYEEKAES